MERSERDPGGDFSLPTPAYRHVSRRGSETATLEIGDQGPWPTIAAGILECLRQVAAFAEVMTET